MKQVVILLSIVILVACNKEQAGYKEVTIPNGDFESWNGGPLLQTWTTNSCPMCMVPLDMYIVRQDSTPNSGQFATRFTYNGVTAAWAENKFPAAYHPSELSAYVRGNTTALDTVSISIKLLYKGVTVDSGRWLGITSLTNWAKLNIPITQKTGVTDSALIRIDGGRKNGTVLFVDNLRLQ